jgi:methylenetetrahydrofolate reductase (NADPH)
MSLKSALAARKFVITCEIGPPKGTDTTEVKESIEVLRDKVIAANVTDQQGAVMRLGSMATSYLIKQAGLDPIYQATCRDRNRIALQSDLLSAWMLGIENVLCLTGDLPTLGDHPQAKGVFDLDSVQLLQIVSKLNSGFDMVGNALKGKTDFFAGAVVNPGMEGATLEMQIMKMEKKIKAGAKFFQTQGIYEPDKFAKFMKRVEGFGVPVLAGIIPLKSAGMAKYMNKNIAGVFVPEELINRMAKAEDKAKTGIEMAGTLIKDLKDICQGVHIMAIGWEKKVPQIIEAAGLQNNN